MAALNTVGRSVAPWWGSGCRPCVRHNWTVVYNFIYARDQEKKVFRIKLSFVLARLDTASLEKNQRYITDSLRHASSSRAKHCFRLTSSAARFSFT